MHRLSIQPRVSSKSIVDLFSATCSKMQLTLVILFTGLLGMVSTSVNAQSPGDYRSVASGDWTTLSTWERYDGSLWQAAVAAPSSTDNVITIQNGNSVTVNSLVVVDQVIVATGGSLSINTGGQLSINDGTGTDLSVNSGGAVTNMGSIQMNGSNVSFNSASFTNFGTLQFSAAAVLDLVNTTTNLNGNTAIAGSGNININGGTTNIGFAVQVPSGITVNFSAGIIQGGNTIRFLTGAAMNWSGGEFRGFAGMIINSGATLSITNTVGIKGENLITNNGTATWASGSTIQYGAGGSNGQIQNNGVFNIAGATGFVDGGGGSNTFYFTNEASATLNKTIGNTTLDTRAFFENSGIVNIQSGTLTINSSFSTYAGSFNISAGAELTGTANTNFTGNTFTNNGKVSTNELAFTGSAAQTLIGNGEIQTLRMNNASGLTLTGSPDVYFFLHFVNGKINTGANALRFTAAGNNITGASQNSYVNGAVQRNYAAGTSTMAFPIGNASYYSPVSLTLNGVATTAQIIARNFDGDQNQINSSPLNANKTVNSNWTFDDTGVFTSADINFNWQTAQVDAGANTAAFVVAEIDTDFTNWVLISSNSPLSNSINATGITDFRDRYYSIGELDPGT